MSSTRTIIAEVELPPTDRLQLTEFTADDSHAVVSYLKDSEPSFLESLGFNVDELPSRTQLYDIWQPHHLPLQTLNEDALSLCVSGGFIGYVVLADLSFGDSAIFHLHLTSQKHRNLGIVSSCFLDFMGAICRRYQLKKVVFEPSADNKPMNHVIEKFGLKANQSFKAKRVFNKKRLINRYVVPASRFHELASGRI